MSEVPKIEKNTRLMILKLLAYFANWLPQKKLLDIYKAVILKVEKGIFKWSAELIPKVESMLDRAVSTNRFKKEEPRGNEKENTERKEKYKKELGIITKTGERVVYCLEFNKNKCERESSHEGKFAGKEVFKLHVCRACLSSDKEKRFHPEGDDKCPNKST